MAGRTCRLYGHNQILLVLPSVLVAGGQRTVHGEREGVVLYDAQPPEALDHHPTPRGLLAAGVGRVKSGEYGFKEEGNPWPSIRGLAVRKGKHDADLSMSDRVLVKRGGEIS